MVKVLIDIDEAVLARVAECFGTRSPSETVDAALEAVVDTGRAAALAEMRALVAEGGLDLDILRDKHHYRR